MTKRIVKNIALGLVSIFALILLILLGYVIYVAVQYYRIEDNLALTTSDNTSQKVAVGQEYSVVSYNVGFAAYSPEYSFFMDAGVMQDGTPTYGIYAKGKDKADVEKNVAGQVATLQDLNADFCFLQEVDENSHRSYCVNMLDRFATELSGYSSTYACNFHTANLFYPFNDPIGIINSGIQTLSKYNMASSVRRSFPVTSDFIDKLFDLDRCFSMHYLPIEGSEKILVFISEITTGYAGGYLISFSFKHNFG